MENETRKLQMIILSIAKEIIKICEENHIMYSMNGGTLLGAIRHKGFIPWDDDLDLCMDRKNYDKFLKVCQTQLDKKKYFLQTIDSEEHYGFSFAKIQLLGTEIIEDFSANVPIHHGIFVDIFPLDHLPDGKFQRQCFLFANHIYKNMHWIKCGYGTEEQKKKFSFYIFKLLSSFYSIDKLKEKRSCLITKYKNLQTRDVFISDYPNEIMPTQWMKNLVKYSFEDTTMFGIQEAKQYLINAYGNDYYKLPPEEKRVQHSHYQIDFGQY